MGPVVEIDDPADPRLADYRSLTEVALRIRFEPPHGLFIAEGALVIERARAAGYSLRSALMTPEWLERTAPVLSNSDAPVYLGSDATLRALTGFHVHRGALASVQRQPLRTLGDVIRSARRLAVIEDMVNHTNLGAIFRTAAALGVDGVVISPRAADPLYRRSVRVSMGAVFTVPYARAETWPDAIDEVKAAGFRTLALTPRDGALDLGEVAHPLVPGRLHGDHLGAQRRVEHGEFGAYALHLRQSHGRVSGDDTNQILRHEGTIAPRDRAR